MREIYARDLPKQNGIDCKQFELYLAASHDLETFIQRFDINADVVPNRILLSTCTETNKNLMRNIRPRILSVVSFRDNRNKRINWAS